MISKECFKFQFDDVIVNKHSLETYIVTGRVYDVDIGELMYELERQYDGKLLSYSIESIESVFKLIPKGE